MEIPRIGFFLILYLVLLPCTIYCGLMIIAVNIAQSYNLFFIYYYITIPHLAKNVVKRAGRGNCGWWFLVQSVSKETTPGCVMIL